MLLPLLLLLPCLSAGHDERKCYGVQSNCEEDCSRVNGTCYERFAGTARCSNNVGDLQDIYICVVFVPFVLQYWHILLIAISAAAVLTTFACLMIYCIRNRMKTSKSYDVTLKSTSMSGALA